MRTLNCKKVNAALKGSREVQKSVETLNKMEELHILNYPPVMNLSIGQTKISIVVSWVLDSL